MVAGKVLCAIGSLADGSSQTATIVVRVDPADDGGQLENDVSAGSALPDPDLSDNSAVQTIQVADQADLAVTLASGNSAASAGQPLTCTIRVTNNGPSNATNVSLEGQVPDGLQSGSVRTTRGACSTGGGQLSCNLGNLAAGAAAVITLSGKVSPSQRDALETTLSATADQPAPNQGNHHLSLTLPVAALAGLTLAQQVSPPAPVAGASLSYLLTVHNTGPASANAVTVTDTLPAAVKLAEATPVGQGACSVAGQVVTCNIGSLAANGEAQIAINGTVAPEGSGTLVSAASGWATEIRGGPAVESLTASLVRRADLSVAASGPASATPGLGASYQVTVTNAGPSTSSHAVLTDTLPAGITFSSAPGNACAADGQEVHCNVGALAPGHATVVTILGAVAQDASGLLVNTFSVSGPEADGNTANNRTTVNTSAGAVADLQLTMSGPLGDVGPWQAIDFDFSVSNRGPSTARGVALMQTLPEGASFVDASGAVCGATGTSVACDLSDLAAGATAQVTVRARMGHSPGGLVVTSGEVSTASADPVATNNTASLAFRTLYVSYWPVFAHDGRYPPGVHVSIQRRDER